MSGSATDTDLGPAAFASIGSVALALYFYYVRDDQLDNIRSLMESDAE